MLVADSVHAAVSQIRANLFRSVLTTLGIVIAVMAVIAVVSILQGMTAYITGFIQGMGSDALWVTPYVPPTASADKIGRVELTVDDAEAIRKHCPSIVRLTPLMQGNADVLWRGQELSVQVIGASTEFQDIRNWYVDAGRYFQELDLSYRKMVCVLGRDTMKKLGAGPEVIGQRIRVDNRVYRVIGLLERKGSFFGNSMDDIVLIPFTTATKVYGSRAARRIAVLAQAANAEATADAAAQVRTLLRSRHHLTTEQPDDFQVATQDQMLDFFDKASRIATIVLAGIVGISLLVGGIGIMNIMLVSVTERTREIGILKALGARPKDILLQFLLEATILSLFGGLVGIFLGYAVGIGVSAFSPLPPTRVPLWAVALSFSFSGLTGVFFGLYPAVKAARLHPIEALRFE
ncbi:MAG: ABC transporter permease [Planctomycetes bacterium]|nr:ABC transporter permease [Planctomycetota bacterium]